MRLSHTIPSCRKRTCSHPHRMRTGSRKAYQLLARPCRSSDHDEHSCRSSKTLMTPQPQLHRHQVSVRDQRSKHQAATAAHTVHRSRSYHPSSTQAAAATLFMTTTALLPYSSHSCPSTQPQLRLADDRDREGALDLEEAVDEPICCAPSWAACLAAPKMVWKKVWSRGGGSISQGALELSRQHERLPFLELPGQCVRDARRHTSCVEAELGTEGAIPVVQRELARAPNRSAINGLSTQIIVAT